MIMGNGPKWDCDYEGCCAKICNLEKWLGKRLRKVQDGDEISGNLKRVEKKW
jgi:hypothetical protein